MNFEGVEVERLVEGNRIFEAEVVVLMAWLRNSFVQSPTFLVNIHAITSVLFR